MTGRSSSSTLHDGCCPLLHHLCLPPTMPPPTLPCHPTGDSQSSSPTPAATSRLPFDIGSIFRRAAAAVDATAAPAAPAEEDEDALAARVAAQAVANAVAANTPAGQQQQQPRGLPGLAGRPAPRGGLPGLPPRPGLAGAGLPARPTGQQQGGEEGGAAAAPAAAAAAPAAPAGPAGLGAPRQQPMLFRRAQPEGEAGGAPAAPAAPPMPTSVVSEGDDDKVRRGAKEGCGKCACRCAICSASAVGCHLPRWWRAAWAAQALAQLLCLPSLLARLFVTVLRLSLCCHCLWSADPQGEAGGAEVPDRHLSCGAAHAGGCNLAIDCRQGCVVPNTHVAEPTSHASIAPAADCLPAPACQAAIFARPHAVPYPRERDAAADVPAGHG